MAFLNLASIAQRPEDPSFLYTERANLTELDGHKPGRKTLSSIPVRIPAVPLDGAQTPPRGVWFFFSRTECKRGVQRSDRTADNLVCEPPLSCCQRMVAAAGHRGLAGQSSCLVNRRSCVQIPTLSHLTGGFALWVLSWTGGPGSASAFRTTFQLRRDPRTLSFLPTEHATSRRWTGTSQEETFAWRSQQLVRRAHSW